MADYGREPKSHHIWQIMMVDFDGLWHDIGHGGEPKARNEIPQWRKFNNTDYKISLYFKPFPPFWCHPKTKLEKFADCQHWSFYGLMLNPITMPSNGKEVSQDVLFLNC